MQRSQDVAPDTPKLPQQGTQNAPHHPGEDINIYDLN
jgi:hypothetical protein